MRWIAVLAGAGSLAGCFDSQLNYCENGAICPATLTCTEHTPTPCASEAEVVACRGLADQAACSTAANPVGICESGVCSACAPELVECRFPEWKPMASPTTANLEALWAVADDDVYAAGGPNVLHYNGTEWSMLPPVPTSFAINGIWASSAGDIVVVVQDGSAFRFGAGAWQDVSPPANGGLLAIWGPDKIDDVFAAGNGGTIMRFNGTTWASLVSNVSGRLSAIWGASSTSLAAAGANGTIQLYSGANWQPAPSTPIVGLTLYGVWTSGTRLVAVGLSSSNMGIAVTREAAAWNTRPATAILADVWGRADDDIYAVGADGLIMRFDGATWMTMSAPTTRSLRAVGGTTANVFAVGDQGTILRYSPN